MTGEVACLADETGGIEPSTGCTRPHGGLQLTLANVPATIAGGALSLYAVRGDNVENTSSHDFPGDHPPHEFFIC
jgi:hypothetical protein